MNLHIDFVSDISCPWCAVGLWSLEQALESLQGEVTAEVHFQPFELNPKMPPGGQDISEHLTEKYGSTPEQQVQIRAAIAQRGLDVGFEFNLAGRGRIYNTFNAHRLLHWAALQSPGQELALKKALVLACHHDGQSMESHDVLLQAVADAAWQARAVWGERNALVQALVRETPAYRSAIDGGLTAEAALKKLVNDAAFMRALREQKTRVQAGFMALDPRGGQIRAWVGSRDFGQDPFDHVQQARRQPGSTFKPFVYGAAFGNGASPDDTLTDQAVEIALPGGEVWRPSDASPPSGRAISLRDGLAYSKNTITAQLMQNVGPERVAKLARAMGVRQSQLDLVPSLALGTSPVTLLEMVAAYGTIANGGNYLAPMLVRAVEDREGHLLEQFEPVNERASAMPRAHALTLTNVMRGVIDEGTGAAIRHRYGIQADLAGKTGTTQDNTDGWFIMMNPQLVAGARVGFNDNSVTMGSWGQGARSALPMVGEVFQQAFQKRWLDAKAEFAIPRPRPPPPPPPPPPLPDPSHDPLSNIFNDVMGRFLRQLQGN